MQFMRNIRRWDIIFIAVLFGLFLVTRLTNLTLLPIFTDEAIYIRWSQIGGNDAAWRFISLTDGKQPLYTWLVMVALRLFDDPLVAGRLVSVAAGAVTAIGLAFVAYELFKSKWVSLVTSLLYVITPFTLMYDRLALYESLSTAFFVINMYLTILLVRTVRLDVALLLGLSLGLGMLNKTSGFLSLYLIPFAFVLFDITSKNRTRRFLRLIVFLLVAAVLSQAVYSILRLSPFFYLISLKDSVFIYPLKEWLEHPFINIWGNLHGQFHWLIQYMTWPLFLASLIPFLLLLKFMREKIFLFFFWIIPFMGLASFGRVLYPRYLLPMAMPLYMLGAVGIVWILGKTKRTFLTLVVLGAIFLPMIYINYFILTNPINASLPEPDRNQLIDDWPAGGGIPEVNSFIAKEIEDGDHITVITDGTFGLLPYAIEIYHGTNSNVTIRGVWPVPDDIPDDIALIASTEPVYLVLNSLSVPPLGWPLELVFEHQKGIRPERTLRLYRVAPEL